MEQLSVVDPHESPAGDEQLDDLRGCCTVFPPENLGNVGRLESGFEESSLDPPGQLVLGAGEHDLVIGERDAVAVESNPTGGVEPLEHLAPRLPRHLSRHARVQVLAGNSRPQGLALVKAGQLLDHRRLQSVPQLALEHPRTVANQ